MRERGLTFDCLKKAWFLKQLAGWQRGDFELADAIRAELLEKGVEIKDTREGVVWKLI